MAMEPATVTKGLAWGIRSKNTGSAVKLQNPEEEGENAVCSATF